LEMGSPGGSLRHIAYRINRDDPTIPSSSMDSVAWQAAKVWNDEFGKRGTNASMNPGGGDLEIIITRDLPPDGALYNANKIWISYDDYMNPNLPLDYIPAVLTHEMGHAFGFMQVGCPGQSVMSDTTRNSYRTNFTPCDIIRNSSGPLYFVA